MTPSIVKVFAAVALGAAFAGIAVLYTTRLHEIPPYLAHDEVLLELNAQSVAASGRGTDGRRWPMFFSDLALGPDGREPLSIYVTALVLKFVRGDEFAIRLSSALVGLVNVVLMFLVGRRYFGTTLSGAGAALVFALTPLHFFQSRVGVEVVYVLPFVLGWLYLLLGSHASELRSRARRVALAVFLLGCSIYGYKAAQFMAPAYLCLTIALVPSLVSTHTAQRFEQWLLTAVAVAAFAVAVLPYFVASARSSRFSSLTDRYAVGETKGSIFENTAELFRYGSLGQRFGRYFSSFNPQLMFFFGEGGWGDSTRQAGMLLAPIGILIVAGLYAALVRRTAEGALVVTAFLLAPLPSFLLSDIAARRMITIVPFGALLAVEGWHFIRRRSWVGLAVATAVTIAAAAHFASYYNDYVGQYPKNSYRYWEMNLRDALRRLVERDVATGRRHQVFVLVDSVYIREYVQLYVNRFGGAGLEKRMEFVRLAGSPLPTPPPAAGLMLRQLASEDTLATVCVPAEGWRVSAITREVDGSPSFVVCERPPTD